MLRNGLELGKAKCPRFADGKPLSDLDWIIKRAKEQPGPGNPVTLPPVGGGVISTARPLSELDLIALHQPHLPGPGTYDTRVDASSVGGGRFSEARPKSELDWKLLHSSEGPGPG